MLALNSRRGLYTAASEIEQKEPSEEINEDVDDYLQVVDYYEITDDPYETINGDTDESHTYDGVFYILGN